MELVHVLSILVVTVSGVFLISQAFRYRRYDSKAPKEFQVTNKKTGKQATISAKPTKDDIKRFRELVH